MIDYTAITFADIVRNAGQAFGFFTLSVQEQYMLPSRIRAELVDNIKYLLSSSLQNYRDAKIHKLKVAAWDDDAKIEQLLDIQP
jgi:hypothetical protein